jgi:hypothetical protein
MGHVFAVKPATYTVFGKQMQGVRLVPMIGREYASRWRVHGLTEGKDFVIHA